MPRKLTPLAERFWKFVDKSGDCWLWTGAIHSTLDYGIIGLGGRAAGVARAHRVSFCLANSVTLDEIEGRVVRHQCDNPRCVNPSHLELGSHADNSHDMVSRGRDNPQRGEANCWHKLTESEVLAIRKLHDPAWHSGFGYKALAAMFGVSDRSVRRIIKREKWKHI